MKAFSRSTGVLFARICLVGCLLAFPAAARAVGPGLDRDPWIALFPGTLEPRLHAAHVPVWDREEGVVIAGPSAAQLARLLAEAITPIWSVPDAGQGIHVLSHDRSFAPPV